MQYPVEPSATISKDVIRQRGRLCADRLKQELNITDMPASDREDSQVEMRTQVTKIVKSDCADLSRFEQGLVCQYVLHGISEIEHADAWLDGLAPISIDQPRSYIKANLAGPRTLKIALPVVHFLEAILPPAEESREFIRWSRSNRASLRTMTAAVLLLVGGVDGLVYELLKRGANANWLPPAVLLAVGVCFLALAVFGTRSRSGIQPTVVAKTVTVAAASGCLLFAAAVLCQAPSPVETGVFVITVILTPVLALIFSKQK